MFMLKYRFNALPSIFDNFFERNEYFHSHNTRNKHLFRTPFISYDIRKRTVRATGVRIYNYFSQFVTLNEKIDSTIPHFKATLKSYIIKNDISFGSMQ